MGVYNRRRYKCGECGAFTFFTKREEDRAGRIRCNACGSARLEVSADGAARQVEAHDRKSEIRARNKRHGNGR